MEQHGNLLQGDTWRISVLTDRLFRLEYQLEGKFTDASTIHVINREFLPVDFTAAETDHQIRIETAYLALTYDGEAFTSRNLEIRLKETGAGWNFGDVYGNDEENLLGTARTLDNTNGPLPMEKGLFSRNGTATLDDSSSALLINGEVRDRADRGWDVYFFGYGTDFAAGLRAFARLTGKTPMLPRYALGNWWSKYEKYTEESYLSLMDQFEKEQVPLSVGVIDMDWHLTKIDPQYGTGWTGFTWNREYFPDYRRFLAKLHEKGLAVTLNLHPADGIRAYESMYEAAAKIAGIDPDSGDPVPFDLSVPTLRKAYFDAVLHPYEDAGVDFWWIDWQQGTRMGQSNVDPLWLCNHYHFEDQRQRGKRAMIFSRYAGAGSHRYPVGFSGDTWSTWQSLAFQPWFTQTASNIDYGWWSHDIGGHMLGDRNDERLVRWVQFGVFSPIMRLHSSASPFFVKEPWKLEEPYRSILDDFLRIRHRLIPYLYTMSYTTWKDDIPLIRPMYYEAPQDARAYDAGNCYAFGTELITGAITEPLDPKLRMAHVSMYLPEGRYMDLLSGRVYTGGRKRNFYRRLHSIPVLLREGGILPLASEENTNARMNPETLDIYCGVGKSGSFVLFEDDGESNEYLEGGGARTRITQEYDPESGLLQIRIDPVEGDTAFVPERRRVRIHLLGVADVSGARADPVRHEAVIDAGVIGRGACEVTWKVRLSGNDHRREVMDLITYAFIEIVTKDRIAELLHRATDAEFLQGIREMDLDPKLVDAIEEIYCD